MTLSKAILIFGARPGISLGTGIPVLAVPEEKAGLRLSELLSMTGASAPAVLPEPMAVLHGLTGGELDEALSALRAAAPEISLRAVTTPVNLSWTAQRLCAELSAEREALKKHKRKIHKT